MFRKVVNLIIPKLEGNTMTYMFEEYLTDTNNCPIEKYQIYPYIAGVELAVSPCLSEPCR